MEKLIALEGQIERWEITVGSVEVINKAVINCHPALLWIEPKEIGLTFFPARI